MNALFKSYDTKDKHRVHLYVTWIPLQSKHNKHLRRPIRETELPVEIHFGEYPPKEKFQKKL